MKTPLAGLNTIARRRSPFGSYIHWLPSGISFISFASIGSTGGRKGRASFTARSYTDPVLRAVAVLMLMTAVAHAERDMCKRGAKYHGRAIDLDVKDADIHDVMRLLA